MEEEEGPSVPLDQSLEQSMPDPVVDEEAKLRLESPIMRAQTQSPSPSKVKEMNTTGTHLVRESKDLDKKSKSELPSKKKQGVSGG